MSRDAEFDPEASELVLGPINKPRWIYSCAKQLMDRVIHAYGMQEGLDYTLFRPFNWIGAGLDSINTAKEGSSRVITQFLGHIVRGEPIKLVDGGTQKRAFTYIDDGIAALVKIIANRDGIATGKIYNIGNPANNWSVRELAEKMLALATRYPEYAENAAKVTLIDTTADAYYGARLPGRAEPRAEDHQHVRRSRLEARRRDGGRADAHLRRVSRAGRRGAAAGRLAQDRCTRRRRARRTSRARSGARRPRNCTSADAPRAQDRRRHAARHARGRADARRDPAQARRHRHVPVLARARPHGTRDQARVPPGLRGQGAPHVGRQALRREDAALRHACCPARTSDAAPPTSCRACATPATRPASTAGTTSAGRTAWQADDAWTHDEMQRACERYTDIFREPPRTHGAAGWQMNVHALRLTQRLGFDYCSDGRGTHPYLPVWNAEPIRCPQFPTTLPTLDELVGHRRRHRGQRRRAPARAHARAGTGRPRLHAARGTRGHAARAGVRAADRRLEGAGLDARAGPHAVRNRRADGAAALHDGARHRSRPHRHAAGAGPEFLADVDLAQAA